MVEYELTHHLKKKKEKKIIILKILPEQLKLNPGEITVITLQIQAY